MQKRSPGPETAISEQEVRQWFIEAGCEAEKLDPIVIDILTTHLSASKLQLCQEMQDGAFRSEVVYVCKRGEEVYQAAATLQAWLHEFQHDRPEKPIVPKLAHLADALHQAMPWLLPPHPNYTKKKQRWHVHVHTVRNLVSQAMQSADREVSFGSPTAPAMRVLCKALTAIHGEDHAPDADAVRKYLRPDRCDGPYRDPWVQYWRRTKRAKFSSR